MEKAGGRGDRPQLGALERSGRRRGQRLEGAHHPGVGRHRPQTGEAVGARLLEDGEGHAQDADRVGRPAVRAGALRRGDGLVREGGVHVHLGAQRVDGLPPRRVQDELPPLQGHRAVVAAERVAQQHAAGEGQEESDHAAASARTGIGSRRHAAQAQKMHSPR